MRDRTVHCGDETNDIAVLVPCLDEDATIANVIHQFRAALPQARIYVYDNNSSDNTACIARDSGAIVRHVARRGKGIVVRRMFTEIDADIYILVDGDDTYDASRASDLINKLKYDNADMVVAARTGVQNNHARRGHAFGNRLFNGIYRLIFGNEFSDIFSGYRAMSRRFVKSFPAASVGFEIETELCVHASQLALPVAEISLPYRDRPPGSTSKLNSFSDGLRLLSTILLLFKEYRPMLFFGVLGAIGASVSVLIAIPLAVEYRHTGLVTRLPTAILCTGIMIISILTIMSGIILDSLRRMRADIHRMFYNQN
jgi:glycosyltransferase involved in cell wall biosynthesis